MILRRGWVADEDDDGYVGCGGGFTQNAKNYGYGGFAQNAKDCVLNDFAQNAKV